MAVLITRPDERGTQLVDLLNQSGIVALHLPLVKIEAGRELDQLPSKLTQLKAGDYVFVVSKNAADFAVNTLKNTGFHWRDDLHYVAVGHRTAEHFSALAETNVHYPIQEENSEGVLALTVLQALMKNQNQAENAEKSVLILRGNGGREYLAQQAEAAGAKVDYVECYQRIPLPYNNAEQTSICIRSGVQKIVATSLDMLKTLIEFVPENEQNWLKSCQLITVSQRIAQAAWQAGWQDVIISPKADNQSLLQTLCNLH